MVRVLQLRNDLGFGLFLKQVEQRSIKLMSMPVFELRARTLSIENSKRAAKVTQRSTTLQIVEHT